MKKYAIQSDIIWRPVGSPDNHFPVIYREKRDGPANFAADILCCKLDVVFF